MRRLGGLVLALALVAACSGGGGDSPGEAAGLEPGGERPSTTAAPGRAGAQAATAAPTTEVTTTSTSVTTPTSTTTTLPPAPERLATPPKPTSAVQVVDQLAVLERLVRDPAAPPEQVAKAGHLQQVAYRSLTEHPEWDAEVALRLPADLLPIVQANVHAGRELRALIRRPGETLPAWRIRTPLPAAELRRFYEEAEATYGVPWEYLAAINLVETRMGRIIGLSSAGAQGPMQFLPSTWAAFGTGDINDDHDSIQGAANYLRANGAPLDMPRALLRYNPTPHYVESVTAYARVMAADPRAYEGYYHWQVYLVTVLGDVWLREGFENLERRPVTLFDL